MPMSMTANAEQPLLCKNASPEVLQALLDAVESGLSMCNAETQWVGFTTVPTHNTGTVTGMIVLEKE